MSLLSYADTVLTAYAATDEARDHLLTLSKPFKDCRLPFALKGRMCVPSQYSLVGKQVTVAPSRLAFAIKTGRPPAPNLHVKCEKGTSGCCNPEHMYEATAGTGRRVTHRVRVIPQVKQEVAPSIKENVDHAESSPIAALVLYYEQRLADKMLSKGQEEEYKSHIEKLTLELHTTRVHLAARDVEIKQLQTKLDGIKKALS